MALKELLELVKALCAKSEVSNTEVQQLKKALVALEHDDPTSLPDMEFAQLVQGCLLLLSSGQQAVRQAFQLEVLKTSLLEPLYNNDKGKDHGSLRKRIADGQFVERLTSQLKKVVEDGSLDWVDTWVITLRLFSEGKGLNSILSVIEKAFRVGKSNKKKEYLEEVLNAWRQFIVIFAPRPKAQTNLKLMKVLVEPLIHINFDSVNLCKLNTWQTLTETLASQSGSAAATVVVPFLDFLSEKEKLRRQHPDLVVDCLLYMSETDIIASTCYQKILLCFELLLHTPASRNKLLNLWQSLLELHKNRLNEAESLMNIVMKLSVEDELRELMLVRMKCLMSYKDSSGVDLLKVAVSKIFPKEMNSEIFRSRVLLVYFTQLIDEAESTSREKENSEMFSSIYEMWKCLSDVYCEFVKKAPSDSFTCHDFNIITCVLSTPLYLPLKMFEKAVGALKSYGKVICSRVNPVEFSNEVINQVEDGVKQSIIPVSNCVSAAVIFKDLGLLGVSQWVSCVSREITGGRPQDIVLFLKMLDEALPNLPHRVVFKPPLNCLVKLSPSYQPPYDHTIKTQAVKVLRKLSSYDTENKNTSAGQTEVEEKTARSPRLSQSTFQLRLSKAESKKQKKFVSPSSLFPGTRGRGEVSPGTSPAQSRVESPSHRTFQLSPVSPGRAATSAGCRPTSPGRPNLSPGRPSASPGRPSASPGRPAASPGRPAASPERSATSPGRGPTLPKITECRITSDLHPAPPPISYPLDPAIKLSPTSAFNQATLSTKSVAGRKRQASRSPSPGESPAPKRVASPTPKRVASPTSKRLLSPATKGRAPPVASPLSEKSPVRGGSSPTPLLKLSPGSSFVRKFDPVSEVASSRSYITVTRGRPKSLSRSFSTDDSQDVFVAPVSTGGKRLLTEHQKEVLRERKDDIPALYQDLSQDTLSFSQDSQSLLENTNQKNEIEVGEGADEDNRSKVQENSKSVKSDRKHSGSGKKKKARDYKRLGFEAPGQFWQFESSAGRRSSSKYRKSTGDETEAKPSSGTKKTPSGLKEQEPKTPAGTCISDKDDKPETVKTVPDKRVSKLTTKSDGSVEKKRGRKAKSQANTSAHMEDASPKVIPTIDQETQVDLKKQPLVPQENEKNKLVKKRGRPKKISESLSEVSFQDQNKTINESRTTDSESEISFVFNISEDKTDMEVVVDKEIEDKAVVDEPKAESNPEEAIMKDKGEKTGSFVTDSAQKETTELADVSLAKAEVELLKEEVAGSQESTEAGDHTPPSGRRRKRSNGEVHKFSPKLLRRRSLSLYKSPEKKTPPAEKPKVQITDNEVLAVNLDQVPEVKQIAIKRKTPDGTMEVVISPTKEESAKKPCLTEEMTVLNVTPGVLTSAQHISNNATKPRRQSLMRGWLMTGKLSVKKEEKEDSQDIVESSQDPVESVLSGSRCSEAQSDAGSDTLITKRSRHSVYVSSPQSKRNANSLISQAIKMSQSWPVGNEEDWVVKSPAAPSASPSITILKHASAYSPTKSPAPSAKKRVSFMYPLTTKGLKFTPDKFPSEGKVHRALSSPVSPPVKKSISIRGREVSLTSPATTTSSSPEGKESYSWGRMFKEDGITSEKDMPVQTPSDSPQGKRSDGKMVCQLVQVVGQPNGKEVVLLVDSVLVQPVSMLPADSSVPEVSNQLAGAIPVEDNTSEERDSTGETEETAQSKTQKEAEESHTAESDHTCPEKTSEHLPQEEHFEKDTDNTDSTSAKVLQHLPTENSTLSGLDDSKMMEQSDAVICEDLNSSPSEEQFTHPQHPSDSTILEQPLDTTDSVDQDKLSENCDDNSGQAQISEPLLESLESVKETELSETQESKTESTEITSKGSGNDHIVSEGEVLEDDRVSNGTADALPRIDKLESEKDKEVEGSKVDIIACSVTCKSSEEVFDSDWEVVSSSGLSCHQDAEAMEVEANENIDCSIPSAEDEEMVSEDDEDLVVIRPYQKQGNDNEPLKSVVNQKISEAGETQKTEFPSTVSSQSEPFKPDCNKSESDSVSSMEQTLTDRSIETEKEKLCTESSSVVENSKLPETVSTVVPVVPTTCDESLRPAVKSIEIHGISDSVSSDSVACESHISDVPAPGVIDSSESAHLMSRESEGVLAENSEEDVDRVGLVVECSPFPDEVLTGNTDISLPKQFSREPTVGKDATPPSAQQGALVDKEPVEISCGNTGPVSCMTTIHGGGSLVSGKHGSGLAGSTVGQLGSQSVSRPGSASSGPPRQLPGAQSQSGLPPGITPQHAFLLQLISSMSGRNASSHTPPSGPPRSVPPQPQHSAPPSTSSSAEVKMEVAEVETGAAEPSQVNGGWIPSASDLELMSATSQHLWRLKTGTSPSTNPSDMLQAVRSLRTTQGVATDYFDMLFSQVFVAIHRLEKKMDLVLNQFNGKPPS